ncbi:mitochondrial import translocase, subunit Tom22 [Polychaeton citri CBS 116435]|uniref:Mitochondrial import translocase, subunit Tom22 n=1 Tax=Polychaeton citri CBS 116435 TaxID=1314669 RepID=A0A9P4Q4F8_9PEZI|nr:mitochondrial import translocase, subunit Tom22 [Polychaeton citri CBS 116435]
MVKLEEVPDEELFASQTGPEKEEESDWDTDDESEVSSVASDDALDESLADRLAALADIIPPTYRKSIVSATSKTYSYATSALSFSGKSLWVISTSALLLGVPWALAFSDEQQIQEMEREFRMQQGASELLGQAPAPGTKPAL